MSEIMSQTICELQFEFSNIILLSYNKQILNYTKSKQIQGFFMAEIIFEFKFELANIILIT